MSEHVVLVDENNHVLGTTPKSTVHTIDTPLHRGFSLFLFNAQNQLLLQQRSSKKITWPLIWSNSCCGHPALEETNVEAAIRRARDELGLVLSEVIELLPYRYRFELQGIVENEICPILVARTDQTPAPNPEEVEAVQWVRWQDYLDEINHNPEGYSPWSVEEARLLARSPEFQQWFAAN